jgi:hypothetical protein
VPRRSNPGRTNTYKLVVEPGLSVDLDAFCHANRGAPRVTIMRMAIETYIKEELKKDRQLSKRFVAAKHKILAEIAAETATGSKLHVLRPEKGNV